MLFDRTLRTWLSPFLPFPHLDPLDAIYSCRIFSRLDLLGDVHMEFQQAAVAPEIILGFITGEKSQPVIY